MNGTTRIWAMPCQRRISSSTQAATARARGSHLPITRRAIAKHLNDARQHSDSLLVRDLAAEHGTGFSVRSHPDEIESKTLGYLRSSVTLLQTKAPDDLDDYRILVMDVAESVAAAAKGGDEAEAAEVEKIRQAVGGRPD